MTKKIVATAMGDPVYERTDYSEATALLGANNILNESTIISTAQEHDSSYLVYSFIKRSFDIIISGFGCLALLPVAIGVKVGSLLTGDTKTIFYKQKRVGRDGKLIYIYKFRSMVPNADEVLKELLKKPKYKKEWEKNQKFENDPRITKIGKILRITSLDELPQFINVLKGDMSLIGPRPLIEGELDAHGGDHVLYESVRPGVSGWWAANGRSATTYEKRLELEYYYCKNCSISLDVECMLLTIKAVLLKDGAK